MFRSTTVVFFILMLLAVGFFSRAARADDPTPLDELLDASFFDREPVINRLLDAEPELVNDEKDFQLPLMRACAARSLSAAKLLVTRGAKINIKTADGNSPLWTAVEADDIPITRYLIDLGANPRDLRGPNEKERTLLFAARSKKMVDFLIEQKLDVKAADISGQTPLHVACSEGRREVVEALLDHGAEVETRDHDGRRPVHAAARSMIADATPILAVLELHGANLKAAGFKGQTALHEAALYDRATVVEYLIRRGLNVNAKNDAGKTPLNLAKLGKAQKSIDILLANGAK